MDDAPRWGSIAVGVDVGHHVVAELALVLGGSVKIDLSTAARSSAIWVSVMASPSSRSASASATQSGATWVWIRRADHKPAHVLRRIRGDQRIVVDIVTRGI